jgi:hypothetical protein
MSIYIPFSYFKQNFMLTELLLFSLLLLILHMIASYSSTLANYTDRVIAAG